VKEWLSYEFDESSVSAHKVAVSSDYEAAHQYDSAGRVDEGVPGC
jgi:hypothetical protein